jgi:hypothetical protein
MRLILSQLSGLRYLEVLAVPGEGLGKLSSPHINYISNTRPATLATPCVSNYIGRLFLNPKFLYATSSAGGITKWV